MKKYLSIVLTLIILVSFIGVVGCGAGSISGTYVNENNPDEYLELDDDGTFYLKEMGVGIAGEWEVTDNELRLEWMGMVFTAEIRGNKLYDQDGRVWVKQSTQSETSETQEESSITTVTVDVPAGFNSWANAAIDWAENHLGSDHWYELCLRFVANAFMQEGSPPREVPEGSWYSAWDAVDGDDELDLILEDPDDWRNAPRGALIFFGQTGDNHDGHVGIYLGDSEIIHAYGRVRIDSMTVVGNLDGGKYIGSYIGWAYPPERWRTQSPIAINQFNEMLRLIPDLPETRRNVYINDYARLREDYDIQLPTPEADEETVEAYIEQILLGGIPLVSQTFISGFTPYALFSPIRRENIGFGPQDVDQDIYAGIPPSTLEAARGRYDPTAVADALSNYGYDNEGPHTEEYWGALVYDLGYDGNEIHLSELFSPPFFDYLGRCRQLGVQEGRVFSAADTDHIKIMIDAEQGEMDSLADNPDYYSMSVKVWEMGAYSVFFTDQFMDPELQMGLLSLEQYANLTHILETEPLLGMFNAWATGVGKDDEGPFITVVVVYSEPQEAEHDSAIFEQRIQEGVDPNSGQQWCGIFYRWEIWVDGHLICAKLYGDYADTWDAAGFILWPLFIRNGASN